MKSKLYIVGLMLILSAVIATGCRPQPIRSWPPKEFIEVDASTDKSSYLPGEDIVIKFPFKNLCSEPVTVRPFPPEMQIMLYRPPEIVRSFAAGSGGLKLEPGETVTHTLVWDQQDSSGQQVAPGYYYIDVKDFYIDVTEVGAVSYGFSDGKVLIQFPQGALEKSIEINQSLTVNGIIITLERVELSTMGAKVYAFNVPLDYKPPPPHVMIPANAEYSLDGGLMKEAGWSGLGFREDGLRLSWIMLDPVPKGTKELTFIITKLGDWEGPWKFQVSLE